MSKYFKVEISPTITITYIYGTVHSSLFVCISSLYMQASLGNCALLNTTATESLSQCHLPFSPFRTAKQRIRCANEDSICLYSSSVSTLLWPQDLWTCNTAHLVSN